MHIWCVLDDIYTKVKQLLIANNLLLVKKGHQTLTKCAKYEDYILF